MLLKVLLELFCGLRADVGEDVRGASRQRGLAAAVMKNLGLRNRVLLG